MKRFGLSLTEMRFPSDRPLPADGRPLCVFDLDRTLLDGRSIWHLGERFGVAEKVRAIWDESRKNGIAASEDESRKMATLWAGLSVADFRRACGEVPLRVGAREAVQRLEAMGFVVGVVSASYRDATRRVRDELGLALDLGLDMEDRDGILTGRIASAPLAGSCKQFVCKERVLLDWKARLGSRFTVAVGDGRNDVCMLEAADLGIAIEPCQDELRKVADVVVEQLVDVAAVIAERFQP